MSTDSASPFILLYIVLCRTEIPSVSRMLSVPSEMTFTELHEAIAAAFGWSIEPCTSWVFNMVDQDPLAATKGDDVKRPKTTFTAFWTAPDQEYDVTPAQHSTQLAVGLCMKTAPVGNYWTYDYNISRQPHAIEVIGILTNHQAPKLICLGGFGNISRKAWQFANLVGNGAKVTAGSYDWVRDIAALGDKFGETQKKFEERKKVGANLAAEPKTISNKRAAPSESLSAGDDKVRDKVVKKKRVH